MASRGARPALQRLQIARTPRFDEEADARHPAGAMELDGRLAQLKTDIEREQA